MEKPFTFLFHGKERKADIHISLQSDGCYIFTVLKDDELIREFGRDIDFKTDCEQVLEQRISNKKLYELETAILQGAKQLPEFIFQKSQIQKKSNYPE